MEINEETLDLLLTVASDAMDLCDCNCGYVVLDGVAQDRCDGSCTHGMAQEALRRVRALREARERDRCAS